MNKEQWEKQIQTCKSIAVAAHAEKQTRPGYLKLRTTSKVVELCKRAFSTPFWRHVECIAWLHDVVDDVDVTIDTLRESGVIPIVLDPVAFLKDNRHDEYTQARPALDDLCGTTRQMAYIVMVCEIVVALGGNPANNRDVKYTRSLAEMNWRGPWR